MLALLLPVCIATRVVAQLPDWIASDPFGPDPTLSATPAVRAHVAPSTAPDLAPRPTPGAIVSAIPGVRQATEDLDLRLEVDLLVAEQRARFTSEASSPAEVLWRLTLPADAALAALSVCSLRGGCVDGRPVPDGQAYERLIRPLVHPAEAAPSNARPAPSAVAEVRAGPEATVVEVRAAPLHPGDELRISLQWVAPVRVHGGVVRALLPARPQDERSAPLFARLEAPTLTLPTLDGEVADGRIHEVSAGRDMWLAAHLPAAERRAVIRPFSCRAARCARLALVAGPRASKARNVVVALDASASMSGPARARMALALPALLASLPEGSRLAVLRFASDAEVLVPASDEPQAVDVARLLEATERPVGATTSLAALVQRLDSLLASPPWSDRRPILVILGDGTLTDTEPDRVAAHRLEDLVSEIILVHLGTESTGTLLAGPWPTQVRRWNLVSEAAARRDRPELLVERLRDAWAPLLRAAGQSVPAGSALVRSGPLRPRLLDVLARDGWSTFAHRSGGALERALVALHDRSGGPVFWVAASLDGAPTLAVRASVAPPPSVSPVVSAPSSVPRGGLPAETVLAMLRTRLLPPARACLRHDRAGRPDHAVRAVFRLRLARREVAFARVDGALSQTLRDCLLAAVTTLDVPPFDGEVVVRYPIATASEPRPSVIALDPDVARVVERVTESD
ncbi:MAG: VWA domain-containing protein [Myxococcota bacterium]|nr:VWA domain-containing protein [Myxococcota bacterium]MDW8361359.1 vWA domain-containing protein [Myxococcales bacterium]